MKSQRRTQAERTAATRDALIGVARELFGARGYADVSTPEIAAAAGVTRGALYHQFGDKHGLFLAVVDAVEVRITERLRERIAGLDSPDPARALGVAVEAWLDMCEEPEVRQILLVDAPSVLGWAALRDIALEHGLGLTQSLLDAAVAAGQLEPVPTAPLAHILIGALDEAALYVAAGGDRGEVAATLARLVAGLMLPGGDPPAQTPGQSGPTPGG